MTMGARITFAIAAAASAGLLGATPARAEVIRDAELGFTLTLPPGFVDYPPGRAQPKAALYSYIKGEAGSDDVAIVGILPMGGTIDRGPLDRRALTEAKGVEFSLSTAKWKSLDVQVIVGVARQQDETVLVQVAQVPLKREAIQLTIVGPEARRAELTALLQTLLASLDGESNWLTNSERAYKAGEAAGGLVAVAVVVLVFWRLSKRPGGPAAGAPATRG